MYIEDILDVLERLEDVGLLTVQWDGVTDELEVLGFCSKDDPNCEDVTDAE